MKESAQKFTTNENFSHLENDTTVILPYGR